MTPLKLVLLGIGLMVVGILLPLGMMFHLIRTTFALCFLAFGASVAGMLLGVVGATQYVAGRRGVD